MRLWSAALFASAIFLTSAPAHAVMEDYPSVKLQGLDKSVGRTVTFEAKVGSTIQYGTLYVKIQACRKSQPIEKPESAAFVQIWEVPPGAKKSEWIFSGWLFASSPALSAVDHPVYDVWVLDCLGKEQPNEEAQKAETKEEADQGNLTPADGQAVPPADAQGTPPAVTDPNAVTPVPGDQTVTDPAAPPTTPNSTGVTPPTMSPVLPGEQAPVTSPGTTTPGQEQGAEAPNRDGWTAYDFMREKQGLPPINRAPAYPIPVPAENPAPVPAPAQNSYEPSENPASPYPVDVPGNSGESGQQVEEEAPNY